MTLEQQLDSRKWPIRFGVQFRFVDTGNGGADVLIASDSVADGSILSTHLVLAKFLQFIHGKGKAIMAGHVPAFYHLAESARLGVDTTRNGHKEYFQYLLSADSNPALANAIGAELNLISENKEELDTFVIPDEKTDIFYLNPRLVDKLMAVDFDKLCA